MPDQILLLGLIDKSVPYVWLSFAKSELGVHLQPMSLNNDAESLLEAALPQAFTAAPVRKEVPQPPGSKTSEDKEQEVVQPAATGDSSGESSSAQEASSETWKEEYEAQVRRWRTQSAEAREKAEKERAKWEAIRAAEKQDAVRKPKESGLESVTEKKGQGSFEVRVAAEPSSQADTTEQQGVSGSHTQADTTDTSQNWEDIHSSPTSSFPSMSFPGRTATPSPSPVTHKDEAPRTATLTIFDSSLSTRTRIKAVLASLAINLLLPFVNGVMLGFGEIFAKNVLIGWFGWKQPGSVAASKGIGISSRRQSKIN